MTLHWLDLALILTIVLVGCAASFLLVLQKLQQIASDRDQKINDQLSALDDAIRALETRFTEYARSQAAAEQAEEELKAGGGQPKNAGEAAKVHPGIRAAIAAAATAFMGRNVLVRSAKLARSSDEVSPWSQQGRVLVQTSHNLPSRR